MKPTEKHDDVASQLSFNEDDLDFLSDKERLIYELRSICVPMDQVAAATGEDIWSAENILSEAIRKIQLRRVVNAQDRRLSWP